MNPLDCQTCRDHLPAFVAGTLAPEFAAEISAHLAHCTNCSTIAAELRLIADGLHEIDCAVPPDQRATEDWEALRMRLMPRPVAPQRSNFMSDPTPIFETTPIASPPSKRPATSRLMRLAPVAAVLLIALISAAVFSAFHHNLGTSTGTVAHDPGCSSAPPSHGSSAAPIGAYLPPYTQLVQMSEVTPSNIWAVGLKRDAHQANPIQGVIYHLLDCTWQQYPVAVSLAKIPLVSISMVAPTEGWATGSLLSNGYEYSIGTLQALVVLHEVNGTWQQVAIPGTEGYVSGSISMYSRNDGWLVADGAGNNPNALFHYTNGSWSLVTLPGKLSAGLADRPLTPVSANDVWLTSQTQTDGNGDFSATIIHISNGQVTSYPLSANTAPGGLAFPSASDGWMSGSVGNPYASNIPQKPVLLHFDGQRWTNVSLPNFVNSPELSSFFTGISLVNAQEGFIIGYKLDPSQANTPLIFYHRSGGQWQPVDLPAMPAIANASATDILTVAPDEAWAFASLPISVSIGSTHFFAFSTAILHYAKGQWVIYEK